MLQKPEWHKRANCYALSTEEALRFFGDSPDCGMSPMTQHRWAQVFCRSCDVRLECLNYCLETDSQDGVWGGMTESQRKRYLNPAIAQDGLSDETLILAMKRCDEIVRNPPLHLMPGSSSEGTPVTIRMGTDLTHQVAI